MLPATISYSLTAIPNIDTTDKCLCMYVGTHIVSYVIIDAQQTIIVFEKYNFEVTDKTLDHFCTSQHWLTQKYKTVKIAFGTPQVSTVPEAFFNSYAMDTFLDTQYGDIKEYKCFNDYVVKEKLYIVYRLNRAFIKTIIHHFPLASWHHYQSMLVQQKKTTAAVHQLYLHFLEDVLVVSFYKNDAFHFGKTFTVTSNEDLVYQLLSIHQVYQINIADVTCTISGWITADSSLYKELYKFLPNLHFANTLSSLTIDHKELEKHFFDIFELLEQSN
jgi:Protein of unknown function (DUF3822)